MCDLVVGTGNGFAFSVAITADGLAPMLPQHVGGISWLDLVPPGQPLLDMTRMNALRYWQGIPNGFGDCHLFCPACHFVGAVMN
jgi:hypothetical protein